MADLFSLISIVYTKQVFLIIFFISIDFLFYPNFPHNFVIDIIHQSSLDKLGNFSCIPNGFVI